MYYTHTHARPLAGKWEKSRYNKCLPITEHIYIYMEEDLQNRLEFIKSDMQEK